MNKFSIGVEVEVISSVVYPHTVGCIGRVKEVYYAFKGGDQYKIVLEDGDSYFYYTHNLKKTEQRPIAAGKPVIITCPHSAYCGEKMTYNVFSGGRHYLFDFSGGRIAFLEGQFEEVIEPNFKVGDAVRVRSEGTFEGERGILTQIDGGVYRVEFMRYFEVEELERA